jgi:hypothetical protein
MRECDSVGHMSRSSSFLLMKVSLSMVFQSGLKTSGGVTAGGARDIITEVVSKSS